MISRFCRCGSRTNAGAHGHAEGCPDNLRVRLFRSTIRVADERRWTISKLVIAGATFYGGVLLSVRSEFDTFGWFSSLVLMLIGIFALWRCCD
jgi:hypothetical protein